MTTKSLVHLENSLISTDEKLTRIGSQTKNLSEKINRLSVSLNSLKAAKESTEERRADILLKIEDEKSRIDNVKSAQLSESSVPKKPKSDPENLVEKSSKESLSLKPSSMFSS